MIQVAVVLGLWFGPNTGADIQLIPDAVLRAIENLRSRPSVDEMYGIGLTGDAYLATKIGPAGRMKG